jgi:hypothetical protein
MGATTTEGTGPGSATLDLPLIVNGVVKAGNVGVNAISESGLNVTPVHVTAATLTVTEADHAGKVVVLDRAAGITATLPQSVGSGASFKFFVLTTVTSNTTVIKVGNTTDVMQGLALAAADGGNGVNGWETASTSDTITLNGTTTGGIRGDVITLVDVYPGVFAVTALLAQTGTEATPFSATV